MITTNTNVCDFVIVARYSVSVYYAHVKKCPKCHQLMEKSGGCQHMVCRCGFDFCWECLSSWNDHGPYLVCPKTHASLTVSKIHSFIMLMCILHHCFYRLTVFID